MVALPSAREAFYLQPLLYPALPEDVAISQASPVALNRSLRCAEPFGAHLYLGSSDGQVHCFVQPPLEDDSENGNFSSSELRHVGTRHISSKPIEKILILATLKVAAVLSEATLTFHELPSFLPIPQQVLPHTKGVASVVLDDEQLSNDLVSTSNQVDPEGLCNLCIIRRKTIMLVKIGIDTWRVLKEIPLPSGAVVARRSGAALCLSTTSEYNMVNLDAARMSYIGLPITQTGEGPSAANRPSIVSIPSKKAGRCQFVITSHSQDSTLGVFVSQEGEPTTKLLEWPSHPRALALEYPHLYALLRNDSIEIHNIATMEKVQTLHLPQLLEPRILSLATSTLELTEQSHAQMSLLRVQLEKGGKRRRLAQGDTISWREQILRKRRTRSRVLLIGRNAVQCLCSGRMLDTAKKALERGDYQRVMQVVDHTWEQRHLIAEESDEAVELEYLNQMVALHCIRMLRFEEAQKYISRGRIDPNVIIHQFPTLFDGVNVDQPIVEMFAEVESGLNELGNLEELPLANLRLNYSPPLDDTTDELLQELARKLRARVYRLLRGLLDEYRLQQKVDLCLLDTCLAKVMIAQGQKDELAQFLQRSEDCDLDVVESDLARMGCYAALLKTRRQRQDWEGALRLSTQLIDAEVVDSTFQGSLEDVIELLENCPHEELTHKYSLWLVQRDADAGIKLLTKDKSSTLRDQHTVLEELRKVDEKAADALLEYTALSKKRYTAEAHMELANVLLSRLQEAFAKEDERSTIEQVTRNYIEGGYAESLVSHMALRCDQTPIIMQRLKLIMLLQGSAILNTESLLERVNQQPMLIFERAILLGRMHRDAQALELLAIELRDANSAEIYCNQNRFALSSVQMQSLAVEQKELILYANFYTKSLKSLKKTDRELKTNLLKTLLQVYMEKGVGNEYQIATAHLLSTQSLDLSPLEVLSLVPADWSLPTLETFLSRSLRKEMHQSNEGQIQRSIALAQNLEVAETLWAKRRGLGGVIEDGTEGDMPECEEEKGQEPPVLVEKDVLEKAAPEVFEVSPDSDKMA